MVNRYRHVYLLTSLGLLIFGFPFVEDAGEWLLTVMLVTILIISIFTVAAHRYEMWIGTALTAAIAVISLSPETDEIVGIGIAGPILGIVYFGYVIVLILRDIFIHAEDVSMDTIYGALSAYMMMGVMWAQVYTVMSVITPGSFELNGAPIIVSAGAFDRFLGFSYVTLTTLGYGNIVPVTPRATSLAVAEAVVGQIYLTVLLARLVAMEISQRRR